MRQKHEHLTAYVLHTRSYRETSLLIDFFTLELGRYSAVAKGVYRGKSPTRFLLQPFNLLSISLQGTSELLTLTSVERANLPKSLENRTLICGLYLNELLVYTLHRHDPHPRLFHAYQRTLEQLPLVPEDKHLAISLREFEFILLEELGYGLHFDQVKNEASDFLYEPPYGFQVASVKTADSFSGKVLKTIAEKNWALAETLTAAKRLTRLALAPLLNGKEIRSRELLTYES
jgi:DNA repair protein RecO (recombination protein O)